MPFVRGGWAEFLAPGLNYMTFTRLRERAPAVHSLQPGEGLYQGLRRHLLHRDLWSSGQEG
jgi:hypothetical protein